MAKNRLVTRFGVMLVAATLSPVAGGPPLAHAVSGTSTTFAPPRWLRAQEASVLRHVFQDANPRRVYYIPYPKKIAVIFEFDHVVRCGICSSPSWAGQPRGRVIRVSFDRRTRQLGGASDGWGMRFCETVGNYPPKSRCLRR
jgi:hypothetical protein